MVLERFESGFAILPYDTWRQCSVQQFLLFKLCNSIPDRRPLVKKNALILDFRMIYRMAQKYVRYTKIYLNSRRKKKKHTYGILSTGTYYKRESNQINGHVLVPTNGDIDWSPAGKKERSYRMAQKYVRYTKIFFHS